MKVSSVGIPTQFYADDSTVFCVNLLYSWEDEAFSVCYICGQGYRQRQSGGKNPWC